MLLMDLRETLPCPECAKFGNCDLLGNEDSDNTRWEITKDSIICHDCEITPTSKALSNAETEIVKLHIIIALCDGALNERQVSKLLGIQVADLRQKRKDIVETALRLYSNKRICS